MRLLTLFAISFTAAALAASPAEAGLFHRRQQQCGQQAGGWFHHKSRTVTTESYSGSYGAACTPAGCEVPCPVPVAVYPAGQGLPSPQAPAKILPLPVAPVPPKSPPAPVGPS
jgi:hypothetical protein